MATEPQLAFGFPYFLLPPPGISYILSDNSPSQYFTFFSQEPHYFHSDLYLRNGKRTQSSQNGPFAEEQSCISVDTQVLLYLPENSKDKFIERYTQHRDSQTFFVIQKFWVGSCTLSSHQATLNLFEIYTACRYVILVVV